MRRGGGGIHQEHREMTEGRAVDRSDVEVKEEQESKMVLRLDSGREHRTGTSLGNM